MLLCFCMYIGKQGYLFSYVALALQERCHTRVSSSKNALLLEYLVRAW